MADSVGAVEDKHGLDNAHDVKKIVPRPPSKRKYEEDLEAFNVSIKEKEVELKKLSSGTDENFHQKLRDLRTEKDVTINRRRKIDSDLRSLNQEISKQNAVLTKVQSNLQYKSEDRIHEAISKLENQLKLTNFRVSEERKIVAEIDALKRSKKALGQYLEVKKHIDDLRQKQRRMREERDLYFKTVTQLKQKEEALKLSAQSRRVQSEQLQNELDDLRDERRVLMASYRSQEKEYQRVQGEMRRRQREDFLLKREEEKRLKQKQYAQDLAEYEASREPFEDERNLCNTLISYLQRHLAPAAPACDTAEGTSPVSGERDLEVQGMFVLRKKTDDDLTSPRSKVNKKGKKDRRKTSQNKPIVHTPQIFASFASLDLNAPSTVTEVAASLEALEEKKKEFAAGRRVVALHADYDCRIQVSVSGLSSLPESLGCMEADAASAGAPSITESAISGSIPSTPEVLLDGPPRFSREGSRGTSPAPGTRQRKLSHDSGACELEDPVCCDETIDVASPCIGGLEPSLARSQQALDDCIGSCRYDNQSLGCPPEGSTLVATSECGPDNKHPSDQHKNSFTKQSYYDIGNVTDNSYSVNFPRLNSDEGRGDQEQTAGVVRRPLLLPGGSTLNS